MLLVRKRRSIPVTSALTESALSRRYGSSWCEPTPYPWGHVDLCRSVTSNAVYSPKGCDHPLKPPCQNPSESGSQGVRSVRDVSRHHRAEGGGFEPPEACTSRLFKCDPGGPRSTPQSADLHVFGGESRRSEPVGLNSSQFMAWIMARNRLRAVHAKVLLEAL